MKRALFYERRQQGLTCRLCPKECVIPEGKTGFCRVRRNQEQVLYVQNYAACSSYALDPIEKKPLYHFYPGSKIFSLGTWGCNFACSFCQNWQIAQETPQTRELPPERAVEIAKNVTEQGNIGIAYTYSEPSVWYEYILDAAQLAKTAGLKNILVTNGYINPEPLAKLLPYIDAMNIDVKAFRQAFYRDMCAGGLEPVKETVKQAASHCHVEVTTLLIPGYNDSAAEVQELAAWLAGVSPLIPLHLSRYFPQHRLRLPPTPLVVLEEAKEHAGKYLDYVYLGNVDNGKTFCPVCRAVVLDRHEGWTNLTKEKTCPVCGADIFIAGEIYFQNS